MCSSFEVTLNFIKACSCWIFIEGKSLSSVIVIFFPFLMHSNTSSFRVGASRVIQSYRCCYGLEIPSLKESLILNPDAASLMF